MKMKTAKYSLWHFSGFVEVWLESWERKSLVNPEPSPNLEQRRVLEGKKHRIFLINAEKVMNRLPIHNKNLRKKNKEKII